jgi:hypothetical protein
MKSRLSIDMTWLSESMSIIVAPELILTRLKRLKDVLDNAMNHGDLAARRSHGFMQ